MKRPDFKEALSSKIGTLLTRGQTGEIEAATDFGKFHCTVQGHTDFAIMQRQFETDTEKFDIPFSSHIPSVQMLFSFGGRSNFNRRESPLSLGPASHCLNYFQEYDCTNLLNGKSRQHDIVFRVNKAVYSDLIAQYLTSADDRLPAMIASGTEFNTINDHLPMDAGILGIVNTILDCPFKGEMRELFIREHLRALLMLQMFHFSQVVTGNAAAEADTRLTGRDRDTLHSIKQHIDVNFLNPSSIETLCRLFGLNEFKLKHGFRTLFDTSPMKYVQYKRLTYALSLLRESDKSIKEISDTIGYSHAANFTTAFSKTFGKTPIEIRGSVARRV